MIDDAKEILRRSYRILAIAIALFVVVWFVWSKDDLPKAAEVSDARPRATQTQPLLSDYPDPSTFERFTYGSGDLTQQNVLEVGGKCTDEFYAILVFSTRADYRADPSVAVVNKAFPCPADKKIEYMIKFEDIPSIQPGTYYIIVADQPIRGLWYNPR